MKYLVVYYSRTGNNKTLGEAIAKAISADIDEIIDKKKRAGKIAWLRAGRDAQTKSLTDIQFEKNPEDYEIIIIGSPIWAGGLTPALRTYLKKHDMKGKKVAFFITSQDEDRENVFAQMSELTNESEIIGTFGILQKPVKNGGFAEQLNGFVERLN